jgi:hypothetical protein
MAMAGIDRLKPQPKGAIGEVCPKLTNITINNIVVQLENPNDRQGQRRTIKR